MVQRANIQRVAHISTATDTVVTADVYGERRLTPLNIVTESLSDAVTQSIQIAAGQMVNKDLSGYIAGISNLIQGKTDKASELLKDINPQFGNLLKDLGVRTAARLVDTLQLGAPVNRAINSLINTGRIANKEELINQHLPNLRMFIGEDVVKKISSGEYKSAKDISSLLVSITGNTEIARAFDITAQFAVLNSAVIKARQLGIDSVLDTVLAEIVDEPDKTQFLLSGVTEAAVKGDLGYIQKTLERSGRAALIAEVPNVIDLMLSGFKDSAILPTFVETCDLLSPDWEKVDRGGIKVDNLAAFASASDVLLKEFQLMERFRIPATLTSIFPPNDLDGICQSMYQYSPFK